MRIRSGYLSSLKAIRITTVVVVTFALTAPGRAQTLSFSNQTGPAGLTMTHTSSAFEYFTMYAPGAAGDFNRDGFQDLFVIGGVGAPDRLFINDGTGHFTDEAAQWGVDFTHFGLGIAVGDYDADGWLDVFITSGGPTPSAPARHLLYRNTGNDSFVEVAQSAGVSFTNALIDGTGSSFGDYDGDGDLDLAVAAWSFRSGGNALFRNNGDGTFTRADSDLLNPDGSQTDMVLPQGFSPRFAHLDDDHFVDLLWISDFSSSKYFVNNGDGTLTNRTAESGTAQDDNGMGVCVGDFNGDQRFDIYVTSIYTFDSQATNVPGTGNMLYMNQGNHVYTEDSVASGTKDGGWGWGTVAADLDHDGDLDIVETNGWAGWGPQFEFVGERSYLFLNDGNASFTESSAASNLNHFSHGRGLINLDADNDGDQDLVFCSNGGDLAYFENQLAGTNTNWLRVTLDTSSHPGLAPDGIGARLTACVGNTCQVRQIDAGTNYGSQSEIAAHFGLGNATVVDELRIDWPDGSQSVYTDITSNQIITLSPCIADFDDNGIVDSNDFFAFLNGFFTGDADIDGSGVTDSEDFFGFLAAFFSGC